MRLVLYQPDIPQNTGTILRMAACFGIPVEVIEPTGFIWSEQRMRRSGMDYLTFAQVSKHVSWQAYLEHRPPGRLILLSTRGTTPLPEMTFEATDHLILGRESAGVPDEIHELADQTVRLPMRAAARSLNVAITAGIVTAEAMRQTDGWPEG